METFESPLAAPPAPVRLRKQTAVSRTTIHGWPSFIFGLPFFVAGMVLGMVWLGYIEVDPGKIHGPRWLVGAGGGMFLIPGLLMMWHGLDGALRMKKIRFEKRVRPQSPWLWDYPWEALGISENKLKEALNATFSLFVFGGFLAPFNWWAFVSEDGVFMVKMIVGFLDVVIGIGVGLNFYRKWALYFKFGSSRLRFDSFPFFLGDACTMTLVGLPSNPEKVEANLRFIEERYEMHGSGRNRRQVVVLYELYKDTQTFSSGEIHNREKFPLEWNLPDNAQLNTHLSERPAKYWEVEVKADTPGVDYHSQFLVPIYAKSS